MEENKRKNSGRKSKEGGHNFEHNVANWLTELFNVEFNVDGRSNTKIDVHNSNSKIRFSVKNPKKGNTQIALFTQKTFIESMNITDEGIIDFISKFFGGDDYEDFERHRMVTSQIDSNLKQKFLDFLNSNIPKILDIVITHGSINQSGDVNYLLWSNIKDKLDSLLLIDLVEFKNILKSGEWIQRESTFWFMVGDKKIFHLQMKGSGKKFTPSYHGLQFHLHNNFDKNCLKNFEVLEGLL